MRELRNTIIEDGLVGGIRPRVLRSQNFSTSKPRSSLVYPHNPGVGLCGIRQSPRNFHKAVTISLICANKILLAPARVVLEVTSQHPDGPGVVTP